MRGSDNFELFLKFLPTYKSEILFCATVALSSFIKEDILHV